MPEPRGHSGVEPTGVVNLEQEVSDVGRVDEKADLKEKGTYQKNQCAVSLWLSLTPSLEVKCSKGATGSISAHSVG